MCSKEAYCKILKILFLAAPLISLVASCLLLLHIEGITKKVGFHWAPVPNTRHWLLITGQMWKLPRPWLQFNQSITTQRSIIYFICYTKTSDPSFHMSSYRLLLLTVWVCWLTDFSTRLDCLTLVAWWCCFCKDPDILKHFLVWPSCWFPWPSWYAALNRIAFHIKWFVCAAN